MAGRRSLGIGAFFQAARQWQRLGPIIRNPF